MTSTKETFSQRLKSARISKNYTQKDMAERLGTTQGAYQKWESGGREPNLETIVSLAEILETDTDYLLGYTIYSKQDWQPLDIFDVSNIKNFSTAERDKLKFSIMFEVTSNKIKALELKNNLIRKYKLDEVETKILNTIFSEVAIEMKEYFGF